MNRLYFLILSEVVLLGLIAWENQKEKVSSDEITVDSNKELSEKTEVTYKQDNTATLTVRKNQSENSSKDYSSFPFIVFDGHFYKKGSQVDQLKIGSKIGEVKRVGNWEIVKNGDSNEVPPGPIYSVIDRSPKEVIAAKQWSNKDVYVVFEKKGPIIQPDKSTIFSAKNDHKEVQIAIQNVREKSSALYEFKDNDRLELSSVSFDPKHSSTVSFL